MDSIDINSGNMQLYSKIDLAEIVKSAIDDVRSSAINKSINVHEKIEIEAMIWGNKTSLRAMVLNIINNAIAYTPTGGDIHINLSYTSDDKNVEFRVIDTGVGIPKEDLPYIFNPFYRTSIAKKVRESGHFGLGLSLVYKIVKEHKGIIHVSSPKEKGAEVIVDLPVSLNEYSSAELKKQKVAVEKL